MKSLTFTINNENGLDARLAGQLVKECIACEGNVTVRCGSKTGNGKTIFNVLALHVKKGGVIDLQIEGGREEEDAARLTNFVEMNS